MNYILVPVRNRRATTAAFVHALARQSTQNFVLVLLDDGSTDGTVEAVRQELPNRLIVVQGSGNWWWGGALHQGWRWLSQRPASYNDAIAICNDDVHLPGDFLETGFALLAREPDAIFVSKARDAEHRIVETCFSIDHQRCEVRLARPGEQIDCAPTRGLFVRWGQMRRIGGFRPYLLPHYLSDLEWTARARRLGIPILTDDQLWLVKDDGKTGVHNLCGRPFGERLTGMLSPKYSGNPLAWSAFILLTFPARSWAHALSRVALWTAGAVLGR